jgi:hypothetical protein
VTQKEKEKAKTDREKLETLLEILLIVGFKSGSPSLEFEFEGHFEGIGSWGRRCWRRVEEGADNLFV